jgi:hypothetical protein
MFDKFEPFQDLEKVYFEFRPSRYEIWMKTKMVKSGYTKSLIVANVVYQNGFERVEVSFEDNMLNDEIARINTFDRFISMGDRLQLIIIPSETNVVYDAITVFLDQVGPTRSYKNFNYNESYCCNLFLKNGVIAKITFAFANPGKLIEFYE